MSTESGFNYSKFLTGQKLVLTNQKIQDCKIAELPCDTVEIHNCVFKNILFHNTFKDASVCIQNCEFINCELTDTYENAAFVMGDSIFKNCMFEGIKIHDSTGQQSSFSNNQLYECKFKNIKIDAGIKIAGNIIQGGSMENFWCCSKTQVGKVGNEISHMKMKDVAVMADMTGTRMKNLIFENVTLEWSKSLDGFYIENCDATGFTLILERYSHYVKNLVL